MDEQTAAADSDNMQLILQLMQQLQIDGIEPTELLSYLAIEAYEEYTRKGQLVSINHAVKMAEYAVQSTPKESSSLPGLLNNFGVMLGARYERKGEMADLEEAIRAAQKAVNSTPEDHPDRAGRLNNLGTKLERRYGRTGEMADLEEAIRAA